MDFKLSLIIILSSIVLWFVYTDYYSSTKIIKSLKDTTNSLEDIRQAEKTRLTHIESGDKASMCAAIYALTGESLLGQSLELAFFINPVDKDEDDIGKIVRLFYAVALEHYKSSGEGGESAKYMTDYTIMDKVSFLKGLDVSGTFKRDYPYACEIIIEGVRKSNDKSIEDIRKLKTL